MNLIKDKDQVKKGNQYLSIAINKLIVLSKASSAPKTTREHSGLVLKNICIMLGFMAMWVDEPVG